ncbi:MAG: cation diffusion facilitator family transporter [archaeon]
MTKEIDNLKQGEKAAIKVSAATLFLVISKGIVGVITGSIALLTDALHSTVDLIVAITSVVSLHLSQRESDEKFQYGYYKAENLASFLISVVILYVAAEFAIEGYRRILSVSSITQPFLAMGITLTSVIISFYLMKYLKKKGEETGSPSLLANSRETLADVLSSITVFIAIGCTYLKIPYIEGIVTIGISIFIFKEGLKTIKDSIFALMDVSPGKEKSKIIRDIAKKINGVKEVKNLKLRRSGPFILGEITIQTSKSADIERAHTVANQIEEKSKKKINHLESIIVHVEPYKPEKRLVAIPTKEKNGLKSEVSDHLGRCEYIAFIKITKEGLNLEEMIRNKYREKEKRAGLSISRDLCKKDADAVVVHSIGEISFHTLRDCFMDIYKTKGETVKEVAEELRVNKLKLLKEPTKKSGDEE